MSPSCINLNDRSGGLQGAFYNLKIRAPAKRLEPSPECGKIRAKSKKTALFQEKRRYMGAVSMNPNATFGP